MFSASQFIMLRERHGKSASRWVCARFNTKAPNISEAGGIEGSQNFQLRFELRGLETVRGTGSYSVCQ